MSTIEGFLRHAIGSIAVAAVALLSAPGSAPGQPRECRVPESFSAFEPGLPKTATALAGGQEVVIVVLGGSSTLGTAAGGPDLAWPARLASALGERLPAARVKVVNLAVARQTAKQAADRLERDVLPLKPTLVIWETGTMEAVRGTGVDEFRETMYVGIEALQAAGTELVLVNMQFSRDTDAMIRFEPYLGAMRELADVYDVPLFHRHGIMRHWAESGVLDLRAKDREKSRRLAAKLYDCIGRAMADLVSRGVPDAEPAGSRR
ncbi:MAG: SGNH/GDSL hydrolase family protein [Candidatus Rokuibacteriota bacterium]